MKTNPDFAQEAKASKEDSNWQSIADVNYDDLEFFVNRCRRTKDKESFDSAIRILQAIKRQVLGDENTKSTKKS